MVGQQAQTAAQVNAGSIIGGKYRVERVLGRGGMGVVLAAKHLELDQDVAIKLLLPAAAANPDASARFLREGRAAARLSSPHVARVFDTGRLPSGDPYLIMEFLHGNDLKAIVERQGAQPLSIVIPWVLEAIDALSEAHRIGIIHRDIKPANMFLARTPTGKQILKIVDFGISKQVEAGNVDLTATAAAFGSPLYMSPEQMLSSKNVDARTDIYSLGAVLFELATGRTPIKAETLAQVIAELLQGRIQPPSTVNPQLPSEFDAIVMRCLRKTPEERYATVDELADALRSLLTLGTLATASPSVGAPSPAPPVPETPNHLPLVSGLAITGNPAASGSSSGPAATAPMSVRTVSSSSGDIVSANPHVPAAAASSPSAGSTHQSWQTTGNIPVAPKRSGAILWTAVGLLAVGGAAMGGYFALGRGEPTPTSAPGESTASSHGSTASPPEVVPSVAQVAPTGSGAVATASARPDAPPIASNEHDVVGDGNRTPPNISKPASTPTAAAPPTAPRTAQPPANVTVAPVPTATVKKPTMY